jgi:hypothetical protein
MVDKRFWSGAIIVATVVVAGASALPALLLAPSAPEPMVPPLAAAPIERKVEPVVARVEPQPAVKAEAPAPAARPLPPPAPAAPVPVLQVVAAPPPVETSSPVVLTTAPVRETASVPFPPVQPVGVVASKTEPVPSIAAPLPISPRAANATADRPVTEKPVRAQRTAAQRVTKRKRHFVRPAFYPLREFLAWRR